jgi:hypothetical protein
MMGNDVTEDHHFTSQVSAPVTVLSIVGNRKYKSAVASNGIMFTKFHEN